MLVCWESAEFLSVLGENSLLLEEGDTGRVILLWPRWLAAKSVCVYECVDRRKHKESTVRVSPSYALV